MYFSINYYKNCDIEVKDMNIKENKKVSKKKYHCDKIGPNGEKCTYETNSYFLYLLHKSTLHAW